MTAVSDGLFEPSSAERWKPPGGGTIGALWRVRMGAAIMAARCVAVLLRLAGRGGQALPGLVAERIYPGVLAVLGARNFPMGVVVVTGTNGKTTTARFLADVLTAQGISFVHNRDGSNPPRGIVSTLACSASLCGRIDAQAGLFEVDEGWLGQIASALPGRVVVVTGLARDQLDRYGEVDMVIDRFREILGSVPAEVCLNADDPLAAGLAGDCRGAVRFFGVSGYPFEPLEDDTAIDAVTRSPLGCTAAVPAPLLSHVDIYESLDGDFGRPDPDVDAVKVESSDLDGSVFDFSSAGVVRRCRIRVGGMFNVYNALAAITAGTAVGIPAGVLIAAVERTVPAFGRLETVDYRGRRLRFLLTPPLS